MYHDIDLSSELKIYKLIEKPHLSYILNSIENRKTVAFSILQRNDDAILLIDSDGFIIDSIFAGLTEKHLEYITKNAPKDYKDNILKLLRDQEMVNGVFEIAKAMDGDLGRGATQNQDRVRNVIQYIKDNRIVFEF